MKKKIYGISAIILLIIASYLLYDNVLTTSYRGTVIQIDGTQILVVTDTNVQFEGELTQEEIWTYYKDSILFYTSDEQRENIQVGDRVKVKPGKGVELSLPPQMSAVKLKKLR